MTTPDSLPAPSLEPATPRISAPRLSKQAWLDFGLKRLTEAGFTALKAETLARDLGVSRGSFYWHFRDIGDFRAAVLERWRVVAAEGVIAEIERDILPPERFKALFLLAFDTDPALERAIRAWATADSVVAAAVERVDERRISYLTVLLQSAGIGSDAAPARARFVYWAYLGRGLAATREGMGITRAALEALAALLVVRPD